MSKLIMLCGLPGSGKSIFAKNIQQRENAIIHSSDNLREELFGDINECSRNDELFKELHRRIKQNLENGNTIIYDATNTSHKKRKAFLESLRNIECYKECYIIATPYEQCLIQNNQRERKVPEFVIKKMYMNFFIPQYYEGWDQINIEWNSNEKYDTNELFNGKNGLNNLNQDNPHHTLTVGKHCLKCSALCEEIKDEFELNIAALYHDIGKRFTKSFKNSKGEITEIAHYYQHHLISAYDTMFYLEDELEDETILKICNYIQWHMQPFFAQTEKARNKFLKLVGQECYDSIMILHDCDVRAK